MIFQDTRREMAGGLVQTSLGEAKEHRTPYLVLRSQKLGGFIGEAPTRPMPTAKQPEGREAGGAPLRPLARTGALAGNPTLPHRTMYSVPRPFQGPCEEDSAGE